MVLPLEVNPFLSDFFLGGFDLTPTYRSVHNKYSVKYFLNLVLIDEEDRRYFKQQEVFFWRKARSKKTQMQLEQKHLTQLTKEPSSENPNNTAEPNETKEVKKAIPSKEKEEQEETN